MGHIHQKVRLRGKRAVTVRMLVDTGATFSVIPRRLARASGIKQPRRSVRVTLADGRRVRLGADLAVVKIDGREAPTMILVALRKKQACLTQKSALPGVRGKGITSRIFLRPVRYIIMRSNPRPNPEWGVEPYLRRSRYHQ